MPLLCVPCPQASLATLCSAQLPFPTIPSLTMVCPQAPVCVDRACCAVLLGDMSAAAQLLGLQQGSPYPQDPEVVAFVKVRVMLWPSWAYVLPLPYVYIPSLSTAALQNTLSSLRTAVGACPVPHSGLVDLWCPMPSTSLKAPCPCLHPTLQENCDRARKGYSTGLVALARSWLKEVALAGFRWVLCVAGASSCLQHMGLMHLDLDLK